MRDYNNPRKDEQTLMENFIEEEEDDESDDEGSSNDEEVSSSSRMGVRFIESSDSESREERSTGDDSALRTPQEQRVIPLPEGDLTLRAVIREINGILGHPLDEIDYIMYFGYPGPTWNNPPKEAYQDLRTKYDMKRSGCEMLAICLTSRNLDHGYVVSYTGTGISTEDEYCPDRTFRFEFDANEDSLRDLVHGMIHREFEMIYVSKLASSDD